MDICKATNECALAAKELVELCAKRSLKLTAAESCTGGLIGALITSVPGSSAVFDGSLVSYSNNIKSSLLGVSEDVLSKDGAVSDACVRQMASGAMRLFEADIAIAVSGIAGPTGAVPGKPVGTVYISVKGKNFYVSRRYNFEGQNRDEVRLSSALEALSLALSAAKAE